MMLRVFGELSICFKSARWDHPEQNITPTGCFVLNNSSGSPIRIESDPLKSRPRWNSL